MQVRRRPELAAVAAALFAASPAFGQQAERQLPEVKVQATPVQEDASGPVGGYRAERSATATKTDTPLHETPQSITVVTRERMEDQGATSLQDALDYAAGVRSDAYGLDSRSDNVEVRGGYPVEYRDGLRRQAGGYYTSTTRVEPYSLERIEVLRGPAAMLYGLGSTAGVVNMVSKRPLAEARREIGLQIGSYGRKQFQTDLSGPLTADGQWLYRLVAVGRDADTQVDFVRDDRMLVAPSLTWRPSAVTSLTLQAFVQKDRSGSTSQFFPWSGTLLPNPNGRLPTNRFIGDPSNDRYDSDRTELGWLFQHRIDERWTVRQNTRFTHNQVDYRSLYADSFSNPGAFADPAQRVVDRFGFFSLRKVSAVTADQMLEGRFTTGPVQHHLLAGLEMVRHKERSRSSFDDPISLGGTVPPIDAYNPVYGPYTPSALADDPGTLQRQTGLYLQDQMKIGGRWIVVAGLRRDRVINSLAGAADEKDSATTVRGGLMYLLDGGFAPYLSYSESFTPLAGTDFFNQRWKPMRGEQIEAGLKWQPPGKRYSASVSIYDLKEKNRQVNDPANPNNQLQTGASRNKGAEFELVGNVLPWLDLSAHYNLLKIDKQLEGEPKHQFAVWGTGRFDVGGITGFKAGLGLRHMGSFTDGTGPAIPSVTLLDAMVGLDGGPWRYALNARNLTDKTYVSTCLARGDCWFGARRTVTATATYRF